MFKYVYQCREVEGLLFHEKLIKIWVSELRVVSFWENNINLEVNFITQVTNI